MLVRIDFFIFYFEIHKIFKNQLQLYFSGLKKNLQELDYFRFEENRKIHKILFVHEFMMLKKITIRHSLCPIPKPSRQLRQRTI